MSILNDFFFGNLTPYEYRQSKETKAMNAKVLDDEEALIGNLPESEQAQRDLLEELFRDRTTLTALSERDAYIEGFKLGVKMTTEIYADKQQR